MNRHSYLVQASKLEFVDSSGRETMGGFDWLVVTVLIAAGVLSAFSPWSFFMGGRFTPLAQWTGFGKMHAAAGGDYGIFLRLAHHQSDDFAGDFAARPNLHGSAIVCTPQGDKYEYPLEGKIRNAWLQTEGRPTGLKLVDRPSQFRDAVLRNAGFETNDLRGVWRHGNLVLDGRRSASASAPSPFKAPHAKRRAQHRGETPAIVVSYGNLAAFNDFCRNEITRTQAQTISQTTSRQ